MLSYPSAETLRVSDLIVWGLKIQPLPRNKTAPLRIMITEIRASTPPQGDGATSTNGYLAQQLLTFKDAGASTNQCSMLTSCYIEVFHLMHVYSLELHTRSEDTKHLDSKNYENQKDIHSFQTKQRRASFLCAGYICGPVGKRRMLVSASVCLRWLVWKGKIMRRVSISIGT